MPPKGKRVDTTEDAFLFVNEDFSTLFGGSKNTDLDRSKQSHVQRQSFAKRRRSRRKGDQNSSAVSPTSSEGIQSPLPGNDSTALGSGLEDQLSLPQFSPNDSLWLPMVVDQIADTTPSQLASPESFDRSQMPQWGYSAPQPVHFEPLPLPLLRTPSSETLQFDSRFGFPPSVAPQVSREGSDEHEQDQPLSPLTTKPSNDPFNNIQYALERWAPALMRHFTLKVVPEIFFTDLQATPLRTMRHVEALHEDMRSCMNDPAEMYALLAINSWDALDRQGKLDLPGLNPQDYDRVTLLFNSKAFEALRLRLSRGELSHGIVIAIQRMIAASLFTSSFPAIEAHYRAQLSMVRALGGLETFNDFQKERLIMHDFYYAISTKSPPRMELTWDPGEVSAEINLESVIYMNQQNIMDAGSRIRKIAEGLEVPLHPVVVRCIPQLLETQQILEYLRTGPYRPAEYKWLTQRRLAILHRLLSIDTGESSSPLKMVRLALFQYCVLVRAFPRVNGPLIDKYVVPEMKTWRVGAILEAFGKCTDLLLWVMVMFGIGIAERRARSSLPGREYSGNSPRAAAASYSLADTEYSDVAHTVARVSTTVCKRLGIRTEAHLQRVLRMFLLDDKLMSDAYTDFVREEMQLSS